MTHRLPLVRSLFGASLAVAAVAAVAGVVAVGGGADTAVEASGSDFVETFDAPGSLDRFDFAIHHPVLSATPISSWQGDHDTGCGGPTTTRTINLPGNRRPGDGKTYTTDVGDAVYWCAPGGAGTGHVMTSFNTTGYAQIDFSPKQVFDDVRRVCWDQNMTDLGSRKWTQLVIVGMDDFLANGSRFDYVGPSLDAGPSALATKLPRDAFLLEVRGGSSTVHSNGRGDSNFRGYVNDEKAKRFTTCVTDLRNGRVEVEFERESGVDKRTHPGSFPDGEVRVIFQDDTYNAPKAPPSKNVPNPFTWHWDNVLVSTSPFTPPPGFVERNPAIGPAGQLCFGVSGSPGDAAIVNLTPVLAQGRGNGQLISSDVKANPPNASNVNFRPGSVDPNVAVARIGADGKVCYQNSNQSGVHVVADHLGTIDGDAYTPATASGAPDRKIDTRSSGEIVGPAGQLCFGVSGSPGDAAIVNLTPVLAQGRGNGQLISSDVKANPPNASNVNFRPGSVDPNVAVARIGADGKVCYQNSNQSGVHVVADHLGTIDGDAYTPATASGAPDRKIDTRDGTSE